MKITFKESPVTLKGTPVQVGDTLPAFTLIDNGLAPVESSQLKGVRVFVAVPSLDTGVCDAEVRNFNKKAASLPGVAIYAVSMDLPFAQARWCGAAGVEAVQTLSDYKMHSFAKATGTYVEELGLLTRAVFIVDKNDKVVYAEYVPEITNQPEFDAIYAKLEEISK